jgi:hypothetical protein
MIEKLRVRIEIYERRNRQCRYVLFFPKIERVGRRKVCGPVECDYPKTLLTLSGVLKRAVGV